MEGSSGRGFASFFQGFNAGGGNLMSLNLSVFKKKFIKGFCACRCLDFRKIQAWCIHIADSKVGARTRACDVKGSHLPTKRRARKKNVKDPVKMTI